VIIVLYHRITNEFYLYTNEDWYHRLFPHEFYDSTLEDALLEGFEVIGEL
jgi:hypothetical protein